VDGLRVVRTGLQPGERIVINGLQRARPGAKVQPTMAPMAPADSAGGAVAAAAGEGGAR
jgi:multidrug efflux system membrane fusion protein